MVNWHISEYTDKATMLENVNSFAHLINSWLGI